MEEESMGKETTTDPICSIIKPEPRTIKIDQHSLKPQPPEVSPHDTNFTKHVPDLSDLTLSNFTLEPGQTNSDLATKTARKTRWTSSPPSRRDSGSAGSEDATRAGHSAAVCPESPTAKPTDSPGKTRSNSSSMVHSGNMLWQFLEIEFLTERNSSIFFFTVVPRRRSG